MPIPTDLAAGNYSVFVVTKPGTNYSTASIDSTVTVAEPRLPTARWRVGQFLEQISSDANFLSPNHCIKLLYIVIYRNNLC